MPTISLSLTTLFEQTFGYKTQAFNPEFTDVQGDMAPNRIEQGSQGAPYYAQDALGKEYFMPVTFTFPAATSQVGSSGGAMNQYTLSYPVISITGRKTIIETPLTERRGTVKELINLMDYEIVIRGFLINAQNEFPENDTVQLRTLYEQNVALSIQCPLTDIFLLRPDRKGSDQVVITNLKFPAITGVKHVRPYELRLLSDEAFNLVEIG